MAHYDDPTPLPQCGPKALRVLGALALAGGTAPADLVSKVTGLELWTNRADADVAQWSTQSGPVTRLNPNANPADIVSLLSDPERHELLHRWLGALPDPTSGPLLAEISEQVGVQLEQSGDLVSAWRAFHRAAFGHLARGEVDAAIRVFHRVMDVLALTSGAEDERYGTCVEVGHALIEAGWASAADTLIQRELARTHPAFELNQEAVLLAVCADAASRSGDVQRARLLLAEAQCLIEDPTSENAELVDRVAMDRALFDTDLVAIQTISDRLSVRAIALHSDLDPVGQIGKAMALLDEGSVIEADQLADSAYLQARKAGDLKLAARALYARGIIESTLNGPSPTSLEYTGRAVLLANTRPDSETLPRLGSGLAVDQMEAGHIRQAKTTVHGLKDLLKDASGELDYHQMRVMVSLCEGDLNQARLSLDESDPIATAQHSPQDSGLQLRLRAEYFRRSRQHGDAIDSIRAAGVWLLESPNEGLRREVVLEAMRCHRAAGEIPLHVLEDWVPRIGSRGRANHAFRNACRAVADGSPLELEEAAHLMQQSNYGYEALVLRLEAQLVAPPNRSSAQELRADADRAGALWIAREASALHDKAAPLVAKPHDLPTLNKRITPREADVLSYAAQGLTNTEIAAELFLSPRTVSTHLTRLFRKLGVRNRAEAAALWAQLQETRTS